MKKNEIRQAKVLQHLVEEYIQSGEPVSSGLISERYIKEASPATIRIDLNRLEKANLIFQPHTSAGRMPTIQGYRHYISQIAAELKKARFGQSNILRDILIKHYKDIPLALHFIMQLLARETDQLSFVAEPEVSYGYLDKLDVFKISDDKLLFVVSLDSGLDKTVIIKCDNQLTEQQLRALVRYVNDEFAGYRIYDIQNRYLNETSEKVTQENRLLRNFLDEMRSAFSEISNYFIHFDGNITFLEQPEFDDKKSILTFLGFIQRQDYLVNLMQKFDSQDPYLVIMGEDLGQPKLHNYSLIFSRYEIFGIPGYLGIVGPMRMDYRKYIPIIRDVAGMITSTTKKGVVVARNEQ